MFFFIFILLLSTIRAENVDLNLETDKSDWVDLLDPFAGEMQSTSLGAVQNCENPNEIMQINRLIATNEQLKSKKSDSVDVLLKHILRQFLLRLDVQLVDGYNVEKFARVYLSPSDVAVLMEYLKSERHSEEVALREKVRGALEKFLVVENYQEESGLIPTIRKWLPYLFILNVIFLPFAIFNVLRSIFGPHQFFRFVLIASFCVSYYFTYIRKYQEVLAERFLRVHNPTDVCSPKGLISEAFGVLLSYVKIKGKDHCLQKYEDMLIEPFLLVDPLQIFGEVVTNFLMSPFSVLGIHLNKFFNDFFIDTPFILALVKLVFIILMLFYLSGYRIRTILGTIEPTVGPPNAAQRYILEEDFRPPPVAQRVEYRDVSNNQQSASQSDVFDLPILNLDDSNVTRRRKVKKNRSQSMPRLSQTCH